MSPLAFIVSLLATGMACLAPALAQTLPAPGSPGESRPPFDPAPEQRSKGRGSVSIGYHNTYINGKLFPTGRVEIGSIRLQSLSLAVNYFLTDHWSVHADIPFINARYRGGSPHCPTALPPQCAGRPALATPHPESGFLDDGSYHGAWQDWRLGVAWHKDFDGYLLTPSVSAHIPSHKYPFFAQAAVGQRLWRIDTSLELAHQFDLSNIYYRARVGHVFAQKTFGQSIDYNTIDLELGYFLNERWTLRAFAVDKKGKGYTGGYDPTSEVYYHHDQRATHDYTNVGAGFDWHFMEGHSLSVSAQKLRRGNFVNDFKYSLDARLTKEF